MTVTSIQGESLDQKWGTVADRRMDQDTVEEYVAGASPQVVRCRKRGRHDYERQQAQSPIFISYDEDGLYTRQMMTCECCGLVGRWEFWLCTRVGKKGLRWELVDARSDYTLRGPNGEQYRAEPGHGWMAPRQVQSAVMTNALHGQTLTQIRADIKRQQKIEKEAQLERLQEKYAAEPTSDNHSQASA